MDLFKRAWLITKRRWPLLLLPVVLAVIAAGALNVLVPASYTASTTLFLRAPDLKTSASAYQGNLFTVQRAQSYVNMIQSDELAQLVVDRLALETTAHELASRVSATPIRDTVLMTVSVTDTDADQAANLANTYGTEFGTYVARVEAVQLTADMPPLVTIVKPATASDATSSAMPLFVQVVLALVLGLLVGIALMWLAERYDTKIRSRRQLEEVVRGNVLGNLPQTRSLKAGESVDEAFESSRDFAEAARIAAINVEHTLREVSKPDGAAVLTVASANHGDGKSVIAAALAAALTERGRRAGLLKLTPSGAATDTEVFAAVPTRILRLGDALDERNIASAVEELSSSSDFIIIDPHSSGASAEVQVAASHSDAIVIVVRPIHTERTSLSDLVEAMALLGTPVLGVITNRAKETMTAERSYQ